MNKNHMQSSANPFGSRGLKCECRRHLQAEADLPGWECVRLYLLSEIQAGNHIETTVFHKKWWRKDWSLELQFKVHSPADATTVMRQLYRNVTVVFRTRSSPLLDAFLSKYDTLSSGHVTSPSDPEHFSRPLPWPDSLRLNENDECFVVLYHDGDLIVILEHESEKAFDH